MEPAEVRPFTIRPGRLNGLPGADIRPVDKRDDESEHDFLPYSASRWMPDILNLSLGTSQSPMRQTVKGIFNFEVYAGGVMHPAERPQSDVPPLQRAAPHHVGITQPELRFLLLVEIANFPDLRRRLGCASASLLAAHAAERLGEALPAAATAIIGRELISCTASGYSEDELRSAVDAVQSAFSRPFRVGTVLIRIEPTIGAVATSADGEDDVETAERAELALAEARRAQRTAESPRTTAEFDAHQVAEAFREAIDRDQLELHYQPKVHVRRQEITSAEALIRWRHPSRGLIMPGEFITVAEECQLIGPMTLWVIRRAIEDQRAMVARGYDLRLFINISGQLLADAGFVRHACELVAGSDAKLGFEITETSVIRDPSVAIANLQLFADYGITIAIDDYGAGLSSLAYLKQLPARELKIDKLFVTQLTSSHRDPLIVRSTIDLAHALEMEVVAEGVETHAALALLTVMGCDMVQGFLISRPVPLDALFKYLGEGAQRASAPDPLALFGQFAAARAQA